MIKLPIYSDTLNSAKNDDDTVLETDAGLR